MELLNLLNASKIVDSLRRLQRCLETLETNPMHWHGLNIVPPMHLTPQRQYSVHDSIKQLRAH